MKINKSVHCLTNNEFTMLEACVEERNIAANSKRFHGNTINSLLKKECIVLRTYANGDFYEYTDWGYTMFDEFKRKNRL